MLKGVSKETKVGSVTALAITVLILGYNYMVGRDNPFKGSREFFVLYDSAQGLAVSTPVMYNGFRVGQLQKIRLDEASNKIVVTLEVYSELAIPKNSHVQIQSELLGGMKLKLRLGTGKEMAQDGDTLLPEYDRDVMSMVNEKVAPIAAGVDSLIGNLNKLITRQSVQESFDRLPALVASITQTLMNVKNIIEEMRPGVATSVNNLAKFSNNLDNYSKSIDQSLKSFAGLSKQMDSIQVGRIANSLEETIAALSAVASDLKSGKGTLGKLATDDALYNNLVQTNASLICLMNDIKAYPQKYIPLPWGKKQRKKAMEQSNTTNLCFPQKDSTN
ncbi:MAG: MCE family protein [Bacteroidia bacterium]|nr:MCE family protein [Bacteroidia bacterium]